MIFPRVTDVLKIFRHPEKRLGVYRPIARHRHNVIFFIKLYTRVSPSFIRESFAFRHRRHPQYRHVDHERIENKYPPARAEVVIHRR